MIHLPFTLNSCYRLNHTISAPTLQSYFVLSVSYSLPEAIFMKDSSLILKESHIPPFKADNEMICQTITAWLLKELQK